MADTRYVIANRLRAAPPPPLAAHWPEPPPAAAIPPAKPAPALEPDYGLVFTVLGVLTFFAFLFWPALGLVLLFFGLFLALLRYIDNRVPSSGRARRPAAQRDPFRDFWSRNQDFWRHHHAFRNHWLRGFEVNEDLLVRSAGAEGEEYVLHLLHALPDDYVLFNQLDIPNPDSSQGVNEADLVVLGPNALFVIEVKHNHGVIQGSEKSPEWHALKTGRGGTDYLKTLRNPVLQVKYTTHLLGKYLRARKAKPWIQAVVVFSHPNARLELQGDFTVPVLVADQMLDYLRRFTPPKPARIHHQRTLDALIQLRQRATAPRATDPATSACSPPPAP